MTASSERVQQACAFMVADHCFAIDADLVTEVLPGGSLSPVPLAPESIVGLLHLRGRIVPVIDMRRRLGFAAPPPSAVRTHLVLRQQDEWYSLLVDEVLDVHDYPAERIEQPAKPVGPATDAVSGVFPGPAGLVHFLDPQRIVQSLVRQRTAPFIRHGASHGG
jgi:purine-binding chemotaxis protein CheW